MRQRNDPFLKCIYLPNKFYTFSVRRYAPCIKQQQFKIVKLKPFFFVEIELDRGGFRT